MSYVLACALFLEFCAVLLVFIGGYALWQRRKNHVSLMNYFAALALSTALYAAGYGAEILDVSLAGKLLWLKVQYLGIPFIPAFWLCVALTYSGREQWLQPRALAALFTVPVLTLALHFTSSFHGLHYQVEGLTANEPFLHVKVHYGLWYWVHFAYLSLAVVGGNLLFLQQWRQAEPLYCRQVLVMFLASLVPWLAYLLYLLKLTPWGLDLTPVFFSCSLLAFACGFFWLQLFDLVPVARAAVFDMISDGIVVLDRKQRLLDSNVAAEKMLPELKEPGCIGRRMETVLPQYTVLLAQVAQREEGEERVRWRLPGKEEEICASRVVPIVDPKGQGSGLIVVLQNVTEEVRLLERLQQAATMDGLTQVYNRTHFFQLCQGEFRKEAADVKTFALIIFDLDHFKRINDTFGHQAGDEVLRQVAKAAQEVLRDSDLLGRYGGEEFILFLPSSSAQEALQVAERLRLRIAALRLLELGEGWPLSASFGVAEGQASLETCLLAADQALYEAKHDGRNCVRVKTPDV